MSDKKLTKEERLAAALRANLRKRKAGAADSDAAKSAEAPKSEQG